MGGRAAPCCPAFPGCKSNAEAMVPQLKKTLGPGIGSGRQAPQPRPCPARRRTFASATLTNSSAVTASRCWKYRTAGPGEDAWWVACYLAAAVVSRQLMPPARLHARAERSSAAAEKGSPAGRAVLRRGAALPPGSANLLSGSYPLGSLGMDASGPSHGISAGSPALARCTARAAAQRTGSGALAIGTPAPPPCQLHAIASAARLRSMALGKGSPTLGAFCQGSRGPIPGLTSPGQVQLHASTPPRPAQRLTVCRP